MERRLKTISVNGVKCSNLYRDLSRRGFSKQDFYNEIFENYQEYATDRKYGSPTLSKKGVLEIAKQLDIVEDYGQGGYSGSRYTIQWKGETRFRPAQNKREIENKIADRCGFELSGKQFGKADLFDIIHEIQNGDQNE